MTQNKFGVIVTPQVYRAISALRKQKTKYDVKRALKKFVPKDKERQKVMIKRTTEKLENRVQKAQDRILKKSSQIFSRGKHSKSDVYYRNYTLGELAREKDKFTRGAKIRAKKLRDDAKRLRKYNPRKAESNNKKARLALAEAKRVNTLLDSRIKRIVDKNTQILSRSLVSGIIPGAVAGYVGYEAYIGTEPGLQRLLVNAEQTCGKNYSKNKWRCPEPEEWYQEQAKLIRKELKVVKDKPLPAQVVRGLIKGAEELMYMEALNTINIDTSGFPIIQDLEPQPIKDYELQGIALGSLVGGALGVAQYLGKKGAEKIKMRTKRFR